MFSSIKPDAEQINCAVAYVRLDIADAVLAHPQCPEMLKILDPVTLPIDQHSYLCWDLSGPHNRRHTELQRELSRVTHNVFYKSLRPYSQNMTGVCGAVVMEGGAIDRYGNYFVAMDKLINLQTQVCLRQQVLARQIDPHSLFLTKNALMSLKLAQIAPTLLNTVTDLTEVPDFTQQAALCQVGLYAHNAFVNETTAIRREKHDLLQFLADYYPNQFQLCLMATNPHDDAFSFGQLPAYPLKWVTQISVLGKPAVPYLHKAHQLPSVTDMLNVWPLEEIPF